MRLRLALVCATLSTSCGPRPGPRPPLAAGDSYQAIPAGFDFPADRAALLAARDAGDVATMRRHAWNVFAGLSQPAPGGGPLWETWYPRAEVFRFASAQSLTERRRVRRFDTPRQLHRPGVGPQSVGQSLLSEVLFNGDARAHIKGNTLYTKQHLNELQHALTADLPPDKRAIKEFPKEAIALKVVWWPVRGDGVQTPMPIWDFTPANPAAESNFWTSWPRFVLIDAQRASVPPDETADGHFAGTAARAHVVSLRSFYYVQLSDDEVRAANDNGRIQGAIFSALGRPLQTGDYVVLAGMHCTTKEIPDWVWTTYWWHDRPDDGPKAADRPATLRAPWNHYLMDVAFSAIVPREPDSSPHIAYNPWLESGFPSGIASNCMACHRRAVWPSDLHFLPVPRGDLPLDDSAAAPDKLRLDFLWSLAFEALDSPQ